MYAGSLSADSALQNLTPENINVTATRLELADASKQEADYFWLCLWLYHGYPPARLTRCSKLSGHLLPLFCMRCPHSDAHRQTTWPCSCMGFGAIQVT